MSSECYKQDIVGFQLLDHGSGIAPDAIHLHDVVAVLHQASWIPCIPHVHETVSLHSLHLDEAVIRMIEVDIQPNWKGVLLPDLHCSLLRPDHLL
jgi:hypothetical protein